MIEYMTIHEQGIPINQPADTTQAFEHCRAWEEWMGGRTHELGVLYPDCFLQFWGPFLDLSQIAT